MTAKKGSGLAYEDLDSPAPAGKQAVPAKAAVDELKPIATRFQMMPGDWRRLKDLGTAERRSFQELLEEGLAAVFAKRGLKPLTGMPRTKNKGR